MTILITGAFGFVGTNLSAYLVAKGHELWALDVEEARSKVLNFESSKVVRGPRQDAKAQRGAYSRCFSWEELEKIPWQDVDAVIHLAGKAHDTRNASDPQSYFDVNVGLTKKILSSLVHYCASALVEKSDAGGQRSEIGFGSTHELAHSRTHALPKFLLFSSVKAVADRVECVLTEDTVQNPQTPYGRSKLEAEREVLKFESSKVLKCGEEKEAVLKCGSSQVRESETAANNTNRAKEDNFRTLELQNFRTYILRPCMIHGPGNKGNLNLLYGVVRKGIPWPLGAFENRRSFASVGNVCAVVEGFLMGDAPSGIYQVADDEALSTNQVIGLISEALGRRARIWHISETLVRAVARAGDVLRLPLNSERLKKLTESYVVSNEKVKRALGWKVMPVSAWEGMRKTIESFSRKGAVGNRQ